MTIRNLEIHQMPTTCFKHRQFKLIIPDEQILLARTFGPAASIRPSQTSAPLPERETETVDTKPKYNVNKVTVAERRKRKRALDLKKMGVNIKS